MLLRRFACVKLFAISLAFASQGQNYERLKAGFNKLPGEVTVPSASQAGGKTNFKSGDCVNHRLSRIEQNFPQNKPSICITFCKAKGFKLAGVMNERCNCGDEIPLEKIDISDEHCQIPCPGQVISVCGGSDWSSITGKEQEWWNIFETDDVLGKCVPSSHVDNWPLLEADDTRHRNKCLRRCENKKFAALGGDLECRCGDQRSQANNAVVCESHTDCFNADISERSGHDQLADQVCLIETSKKDEPGKCVDKAHIAEWDLLPLEPPKIPTSYKFRRQCLKRCGDCYSECDSVNQDDHVCLIKTSETALTEEQSKGCIEALQYLSVQKDTIEIDDKDTCNKFCKKSKSKFGALKGQLCFCGDEAPQTTSWLNLKNTCPMELFEVTGDSASQLGRATLGLGIGAGVLALLLAALALVVFIKQRKKRNDKQRREKENSDFNPVYGTYEVHDDPVAEATDQNFDYGVVYEGEEMSKTTDVNPDYDIYDSLNT